MKDEIRNDLIALMYHIDETCDQHDDYLEILSAYEGKIDAIMSKIDTLVKQGASMTHIIHDKAVDISLYPENKEETPIVHGLNMSGIYRYPIDTSKVTGRGEEDES